MTNYCLGECLSVSELAGRVGAVLDEVEAGATFTVTRRGLPIAVLGPVSSESTSGDGMPTEVAEAPGEYRVGGTRGLGRPPATALARLITTPATRAVMTIFLLDPAAALHQREIARRAGLGLRSAQIVLARLESLGLVASERDGNRRYYRALRTDRFEGLRAMMAREIGVAEVIARHLADTRESVRWAFVFGSAATGEDTLGSDIDLLVIGEATDDALVEPIAAAQRELGREIDVVSYRPAEFEKKRAQGNHFISSVLSGPRFDVIGGPDGA
jgi:prevent-host-death family protein